MSKPVLGTFFSRSAASLVTFAARTAICGLAVSAGIQSIPAAQAAPGSHRSADLSKLPALMERLGRNRAETAAAEQAQNTARASRTVGSATTAASVVTRATTTKTFALTERDITPNTPSDDREPVFSPNGDSIAFLSNRVVTNGVVSAGPYYHVWVMNRDGSGVRQVTGLANQNNGNRNQRHPAWSPDGNTLVYVDELTASTSQLFVVQPLRDTSTSQAGIQVGPAEQRTFGSGIKRSPIFSPSGQEVVYASKTNPLTNTSIPSFDLFSITASGSTNNTQRLTGGTDDPIGNTTDDLNPAFSVVNPNVLYFSSNRAIVNGTQAAITGRRIWLMQSNGQSKRQVSDPTQRPAGKATDSDDFPTTSRLFPDYGSDYYYDYYDDYYGKERIAFQSNSLIDASDTKADLNIWSLKINSNRYAPPSTQTTLQPKSLLVGSYNRDTVVQFDSTTGAEVGNFVDDDIFTTTHIEGVTFGADLNDDGVRDLLVCLRDNFDGAGSVDAFDGVNGERLGTLIRGYGLTNPAGIYYSGSYVYVSSGYDGGAPGSTGKVHRFSAFSGVPAPAQGRTNSDFTDGGGVNLAITNGLEGIAFGPDLNSDFVSDLFVSVLIENKINVYDGAKGTLIAAFPNGFIPNGSGGLSKPTGIAFNEDETQLYVASSGSNQVLVYDVETQALLFSIDNINSPEGVIFGPDGNLYVSNFDSSLTANDGAGNSVNRYSPDGSPLPATGQTGATFASSTLLRGAGYMAFTPAAEAEDDDDEDTTVPPETTIAETVTGTSAVLESNGYSSAATYRQSGLEGSATDASSEINSDKSADREPAFARSDASGTVTSQIAFASQRKKAFAPGATEVNPSGGEQDFNSDTTPTHDIWVTQAADFTPPILIPQAAGNQLYPVVAPGPQSPFASGRRRTYETGLTPGSMVDIALVLKEVDSGIASVSVALYDANIPQFESGGKRTSKVNDDLDVTIAPELKAKSVDGFTSISLQSWDDGPVNKISQRTGVAGHERQANAVEGDGIFYCATRVAAPAFASDFYMDVSVQDASGNYFTYDNVWGFTTKQFVKSGDSDLFVSDYTAGQVFASYFDPSGGFGSGNYRYFDLDPVESYYLKNIGGQVVDIKDPLLEFDDQVRASSSQITFDNVDVWRVQCRGQVPASVLSAYEPTRTQQYDPADFADGKPTELPERTRQVAVSTSSVIWASPYTGLVFAGPGTLDDSEMQTRLTNFLKNGGRLFLSGSDIIYALTNGGTVQNQFLTSELRGKWDGETGGELITAGAGAFSGDLQTNPRNIVPFDPKNTWADASRSGAQYGADSIGAATNTDGVTAAYTLGGKTVGQRVKSERTNGLESRLVFLSFNLDSVNRQYSIDNNKIITVYDKRARIASNVRAYFKTGGISGTVFNNRNEPVEGFILDITGANSSYIAVTNANGQYEVLGLPEGGYTVSPATYTADGVTTATNVGYFPGPVKSPLVNGGSTSRDVNLLVIATKPGSLSGRAILSDTTPDDLTDNLPLANAPVLVRSVQESQLFTGHGQYAQLAQTDANGRYSFADVPSGVELEVIFNPDVADIPEKSGLQEGYDGANPDYGRRIVPDAKREGDILVPIGDAYVLNDGSDDDAGDSEKPIIVNTGVTITGLVQLQRNGVKSEVANATVELLQSGQSKGSTLTGTDGRYTFEDIPVGSYVVKVTTNSLTKSVSITVPRTSTFTVPNILFYIQSLSGKVVYDSDGKPVPSALIEVKSGTKVIKTATASTLGAYTVDNIPAGTYTVVASKSGAVGSVSAVVTNGTNTAVDPIRLKSQSVSGLVRLYTPSNTAGALLANAKVVLKRNGNVIAGPVTTGTNGAFTLASPLVGTFDLEATFVNSYNNTATSVAQQVVVEQGVAKTGLLLKIYMRPVTGKVTLNGQPALASTTVSLYKVQANGTRTLLKQLATSTTDGSYTFEPQPAGTYIVSATAFGDTVESSAFALTNTATVFTVPTIALKTQSISGLVTFNGSPVNGATVQLEQNLKVAKTVATGADGKFTFANVLPGSYVVRAIKDTQRSPDRAVTVVRGTNVTGIALVLANQNFTGRVMWGTAGVSGAAIQLLQSGTVIQTKTTDSTGRYSFGSLPTGTYTVRATKAGLAGSDTATTSFQATAAPATIPNINLVFEKITGQVTLNGTATGGIGVKLYKRNSAGTVGALLATVSTNASGTYTFSPVGAGLYVVEVTREGDTLQANADVVRNGETITMPTFLLRTQRISGRVILNGNAGTGLTVALKPATGTTGTTKNAVTDSTGNYTFTSIIPGSYTVSVTSGELTDTESVTVVSGEDATAPDLVLGGGVVPVPTDDFQPGQTYEFSIPFTDSTSAYVGTTVAKAFSARPLASDGTVNYVLKRWDPVTQLYVAITDPNALIERGVGYSISQVKTGTSVRIKRPEEDASRFPTAVSQFQITLGANSGGGINRIGFPFDPAKFSFALWSATSFIAPKGTVNPNEDVIFNNLNEAVAAGVVSAQIYTLSADGKSYILTDRLEPFKSYMIQSKYNGIKAILKATPK